MKFIFILLFPLSSIAGFTNGGSVDTAQGPLVINGTTVSLPSASSSSDGYLAHGDWTTFNSKISNTLATSLIMGNHKIISMAEPTQASDAATKNYIDTHMALPSAISNPLPSIEGNIYYNTILHKAYVYDGLLWQALW